MAHTNTDNPKEKDTSRSDAEETITKAHEEAEKDINNDPELQPDPAADLDEGELARLEGEE